MNRIAIAQIVDDIRSGLSDEEIIDKHGFPSKAYKKILKVLVLRGAIPHEDLYRDSAMYRDIVDIFASRRTRRIPVPLGVRVFEDKTHQKGFLRDISEIGLRVAGINAKLGEIMHLRMPLEEFSWDRPIEFQAVCRWGKIKGKKRKYIVSGFEIVEISSEIKTKYMNFIELLESELESKNLSEPSIRLDRMSTIIRHIPVETRSRDFSGILEGVDILDIIQLIMLNGKQTVLEIESPEGEKGELYIDKGQIVHATQDGVLGHAAFFHCANLMGGQFQLKPWIEPEKRTMKEPGEFLLIEAARKRDELFRDLGTEISPN
jgi:hypothetical protein